jgi:septal ring factor EnvC (AmiA/AmiB activator)
MASGDLVIRIIGESKQFSASLKKSEDDLNRFGKKTSSVSKGLQVAGAAIVGSAIAIGVSAIKAATEGQKANAQLQNSIKNVGGSYQQYKKQIDETSDRLANFGFENDDVEKSLAALTRVTKSPTVAIKEMGLAADIARGRNIDLASATNILIKVESGHVGALGRLGIATKDATGKTLSHDAAIRKLTELYGGAAQANAGTFAGKMEALSAKTKNLEEKLGNALIPVIEKTVSVLLSGAQKLQAFNEATGGLAGKAALAVVGGLAMISVLGKIAKFGQAGAASIASLVETIQIWVLLNPELALAIGLVAGATAILTLGLRDNAAAHKRVTQAAKNFTDAVRTEGITLGEAVSRELTDFLTKHEDLAPILEKAGISAQDVGKAVAGTAGDYQSVIDKITTYSNKTGELPGVLNDFVNELDTQRSGLAKSKKQLDFNKDVTKGLATATDGLTQSSAQQTDAAAKSAAATKRQGEEAKKATEAQLRLRDAILGSASADLAYEQSVADVADRLKELHDKSVPAAQAQRDVRSSILDVASAAAQQTKALAEQNGKQATATQLRNAERIALDGLKKQYPELRSEIDLYIKRLRLIPNNVGTDVNLNFTASGSVGKVTGSGINVFVNAGGGIQKRAAGGPFGANTPILVGERGPEIATFGQAGTIIPNHKIGSTTNVHLHATVVVQETDAGERQVRKMATALRSGQGKADFIRAIGPN